MNSIRTSHFSSLKSISDLVQLVVLLSLTHSTVAYALPADNPKTVGGDLATFDLPGSGAPGDNFASALSNPSDNFVYDWAPREPLMNHQDLYMAILFCTSKFTLEHGPNEPLAAGICFRPAYDSIGISFAGVASATVPYAMLKGDIVSAIGHGFQAIIRQNRYKKLKVKLYRDRTLIGTVTFAQHRAQGDLEAAATGDSVNYFLRTTGVNIDRVSYYSTIGNVSFHRANLTFLEDSPVGSAEGSAIVKASSQQPALCAEDSVEQVAAGERTHYAFEIRASIERGLTLKAYTMAVVPYVMSLCSNLDEDASKVVVDVVHESPFRTTQVEEQITIWAGYFRVAKRETCPFFTLYALVVGLVEIPPQLIAAHGAFDFFACEVFADGTPIGDIWVQKGLGDSTAAVGGVLPDGVGIVS